MKETNNLYRGAIPSQIGAVIGNRLEGVLSETPKGTSVPQGSRIDEAIARSQEHLFSIQTKSGYWRGELMVDSTIMSDMIAYHHWNGRVDKEWERKAVNHVFSLQLDNGGWNIYYGGPSEVNATVKAYLALKLAGIPATDERMLRAREVARSLGGPPRMNTFSKLYLALFGLYPWKYVPIIPCEIILLGKWFHVNFHEMSNWSRSMLAPLAIINHFKPTRNLARSAPLDELYPEGCHERDLALPKDPQRFTWRNFFLWLDGLHRFVDTYRLRPFRKIALQKNERWMLERLEGSDGLAAIFPAMLNSLIALKALGYPDDHPQVARAERELKKLEHNSNDRVWMEPCMSPVWDTAIVTNALKESGLSSDHPALKRSVPWLMSKEIRIPGDWRVKNPTNVAPSGWAFEFNNKWNADVDDTAMVLMALRGGVSGRSQLVDECFQRGLTWMLTFQCRDGGWAAFDKDCTKSILEKVPFADHNAMLDPECADITARILELLGQEGFRSDHPQIQKALQFLLNQQESDGSWYGRWGVNYIYGTFQVLRGLHSLGLDMTQSCTQKAKRWLEQAQNEDGGWGERCNTYDDPVFKGQGPSTASQTAWAVLGLCAFGDPMNNSLKGGVDYLVKSQCPDGQWTELETTGTGFPRVFYLKYDIYRNAWPLSALGVYRKLLEGSPGRAARETNGARQASPFR